MIYQETISKETRKQKEKEAKARMTKELMEILEMRPEENLRWTGNTIDLIEVAHIAYSSGNVYKDDGRACTFKYIVSRTCEVLHVEEPHFPRQMAYRAGTRKGIRETQFLERYRMATENKNHQGLKEFVAI